MAVVTFDTLKFVKTLEAAGIPPQQAEAMSVAVRDSHETADLATKADLRELEARTDSKFELLRKDIISFEQRIDSKMESLEQRVYSKMESLEQRMTIKLGSMLVLAVGTIAAVVKLL
jgi:hypothetical protein